MARKPGVKSLAEMSCGPKTGVWDSGHLSQCSGSVRSHQAFH